MREIDVLVVGAGLAGATAALTARRAGAEALLVDEFGAAGGWLRWSIAPQDSGAGADSQRGYEIARALANDLSAARLPVTRGVAWGLFEDNVVGLVTDSGSQQLRPHKIILATGSTDVVAPFAGWELPGVLTLRAALRCLHEWRVAPGERVALVGQGSALDEARDAFARAGVAAVAAGDASAVTAGGAGRVEWVALGGTRTPADCVVIALGRQPDAELARQALCEIGYSPTDGAFVPLRGAHLETSVPGVYVVGDAAGCCTAAEARGEGRLAALAAAGAQTADAAAALEALRSPERAADVARLRLPALAGA